MCEYCHSSPHLSGCPYAPDPPVYGKCNNCGKNIYNGDEFYEVGGSICYCEDCVYHTTAEVDFE